MHNLPPVLLVVQVLSAGAVLRGEAAWPVFEAAAVAAPAAIAVWDILQAQKRVRAIRGNILAL